MAPSNNDDDRNDVDTRQHLIISSKALTAPPFDYLPLDLVAEILYRLPVKFLLQLRCICKSWNSLISDPTFMRKHLGMSNRYHLMRSTMYTSVVGLSFFDSTILSNDISNSCLSQTHIPFPMCLKDRFNYPFCVCSCDGILCYTMGRGFALLWNPSIRTFKILSPPLDNISIHDDFFYSFGYDHFINNYKVISTYSYMNENEVNVQTLGTNSWRRIQDFPYPCSDIGPGVYVSGTINWLTHDDSSSSSRVIVSLDLRKESYQRLSQPDNLEKDQWNLGVLKDCLCIFESSSTDMSLDVWVMKEFGNKESWTKVYSIPCMGDPDEYAYSKTLYISEDDQMLMDYFDEVNSRLRLGLYDYRNGTLKMVEYINGTRWMNPVVYNESLTSPCS